MKNNLIAPVIIFLFSLLLSVPLLRPGFFTVHDDQQIARLFLFDKSLKTGQLPPRWVDDLGFGFGYPLFIFYPPFVYMLGEIYHLLGFGFIDSIKLVFFSSFLFSALAMYLFIKDLFGKTPAVVSALFYILAPYRALDVYVRGALAESFSFVWLPLILWSFYKLERTNKAAFLYLSATFLALLMITHNLIFMPFMLLLPFYLLYLVIKSNSKKLSIAHIALSFVIASGLSAFFWLPSLWEKQFTIVDNLLLVNLANYNIHFVYPQQLWNWPWGFGGSATGLADGISFKIGKIHIIVAVAALILGILHLFKDKFKSKFSILTSQLSFLFFALFLFAAFMTTFYSEPIWNLLPPLGYLQFPWRFLTFSIFFASVLAGALIYYLRLPILKLVFSTIFILLLIIPNLKLFKPQTYREDLTDKKATAKETINWYVSSSSFEYIPKGVELYRGSLGTNLFKIEKSQIPTQKIEIENDQAQIQMIKESPSNINFTISAASPTIIKVNIFNFPGWNLKVDNASVPIDDNNKFKLITSTIPEGKHSVRIEFTNTPIINIANALSLVTIFALIIFYIKKWPKIIY